MTEQERIEEAERIVSRAGRGRLLFALAVGAVFLVAVVGLVGAVVANIVNVQQDTRITRVSACEGDARSHDCQQTKLEASKAANLFVTCIPFWKAGYPCPKPGSRAAERRTRRRETAGNAPTPGAGSESASTGHKPTTTPAESHHPVKHVGNSQPKAHGVKPEPSPAPEPAPESARPEPAPEAPAGSTAPEEAPGSSGETPAAQNSNGVKTCLEVAVSACAEVGLPTGH